MRRFLLLSALAAMLLLPASAHAALSAVGPVAAPTAGVAAGFPTFFTDGTGLSLGAGAAPIGGGGGNGGGVAGPIYWSADGTLGAVRLVMIVSGETPLGLPPAVTGKVSLRGGGLQPNTTYTLVFPFGTRQITANATGTVNFVEQQRCAGACPFAAALGTAIGPFLRPDPRIPGNGIANLGLGVSTQLVGSPFGTNFAALVDASGKQFARTDQFLLLGGGMVGAETPLAEVEPVPPLGSQRIGGSTKTTVTIANVSHVAMPMGAASIAGVNAADFAITANTCSGATVPAVGTCTIDVTMRPTAVGPRAAIITLGTPAGNVATVDVAGTGVAAQTFVRRGTRTGVRGGTRTTRHAGVRRQGDALRIARVVIASTLASRGQLATYALRHRATVQAQVVARDGRLVAKSAFVPASAGTHELLLTVRLDAGEYRLRLVAATGAGTRALRTVRFRVVA